MKKAAFYLIMALFSTALVAVEASKLRIDCTDEDTMQKTIMNIMMNLDDSMQKQFAAALATIGVAGMQNPDLTEPARIKNMLDGKNADEVIALSRRMAPNIRSNTRIIDGSSKESFSRTMGEIMVSLDVEKQSKFSEAIALLMYESQKKGETHLDLAKRLDGKNADEVIALAFNKGVPIPKNYEEIREFELSAVSKSEAEKIHGGKIDDNPAIPAEKAPKKSEPSFAPSLVPSQNL
ncbi:unknown [Coraliomargarita sp. CAG:312]|nr:unknown [Coraliomargarita sp. CAG:312]